MGGEDWRPPASRCVGPGCVPLHYRNGTLPLGVPHRVGYPIKLLAGHRRFLLVGLGRITYRPPRHAPAIFQVAQCVPSHLLLPSSHPTHMVHVSTHSPGRIGAIQELESELRSTHLPRTRVNRGKLPGIAARRTPS